MFPRGLSWLAVSGFAGWRSTEEETDTDIENLEKRKTNTDRQLAIRKTEQDTPKICNTYRVDDK